MTREIVNLRKLFYFDEKLKNSLNKHRLELRHAVRRLVHRVSKDEKKNVRVAISMKQNVIINNIEINNQDVKIENENNVNESVDNNVNNDINDIFY